MQTYEEQRNGPKSPVEEPKKYLDHKFYIYALVIPVIFGTRAISIEKTYADPYWVFCIESIFILVICLGLILSLYLYIGSSRVTLFNFFFRYITILESKRVIFLAMLSGF